MYHVTFTDHVNASRVKTATAAKPPWPLIGIASDASK
jgi:hypothetical protein